MTDNTCSTLARIRRRLFAPKPYTAAELTAKGIACEYLRLAKLYASGKDKENAVACCLEGLQATFGISRPLAVRDQLRDLLDSLDPARSFWSRIRAPEAPVPKAGGKASTNASQEFFEQYKSKQEARQKTHPTG